MPYIKCHKRGVLDYLDPVTLFGALITLAYLTPLVATLLN